MIEREPAEYQGQAQAEPEIEALARENGAEEHREGGLEVEEDASLSRGHAAVAERHESLWKEGHDADAEKQDNAGRPSARFQDRPGGSEGEKGKPE